MLKKWMITCKIAAFLAIMVAGIQGSPIASVFAAELARNSTVPPTANLGQVIQIKDVDVTGNGQLNTVTLFGRKDDVQSPLYAQLHIVVSSRGQNDIVIPIQGGYNPQMQFCDLNGDKVPEIFVSIGTEGNGRISNYYVYMVKGNNPVAIPVPNPLHVSANFKNNYRVKLKIDETGKVYNIDLKAKKGEYDQAGIYKNGKLVKPVAITVNVYSDLKPVDIDRDGICELQGIQRITGFSHADTIGYATSVWKLQPSEGKWKLMFSDITK